MVVEFNVALYKLHLFISVKVTPYMGLEKKSTISVESIFKIFVSLDWLPKAHSFSTIFKSLRLLISTNVFPTLVPILYPYKLGVETPNVSDENLKTIEIIGWASTSMPHNSITGPSRSLN